MQAVSLTMPPWPDAEHCASGRTRRSWATRSLRRVLFIAAVVALLTPTATAQVPTIAVGSINDVRSLDPAVAPGSPDRQLITNIFSGLVRYAHGSNDVEPDLATRWEVSPDGRTYTFFLREDVVWHGGYGRFTAHDVVFTFERHLDPSTGSRWRSTVGIVGSVTALDDHTVQFTLRVAYAPFLSAIVAAQAGYVVNRQALADAGANAPFRPIGTGPYRFVSYEPRQRVVLEAFEDFYRGPPEAERSVWYVIPDLNVQALALQRGDLNYMIVRDLETWEALRGRPGIAFTATPATGYYGLALNTSKPPLDDLRVRQAIAHAVDKETFVASFVGAMGRVTDTVIAEGMLGHAPDVTGYPHDPARARALLAEAGHADGLTLTAIFNASNSFEAALMVVLQQWLGDIGVTLELVSLDAGGVTARRRDGDYDLTVANPTRVDPDEILSERFSSASRPPSGTNQSFFASIDDLIEAQRLAIDLVERAAILREIQVRIAEEVPELPLYAPVYVTAYADYLTGDMPNTSNWIVQLDRLRFTDLSRCLPCR